MVLKALLGGTFGKSKEKTSQTQTIEQDVTRTTTGLQRGEQLAETTRQQAGISDISQLDPEIQSLLTSLIGGAAGAGPEKELMDFIQGRAIGGDEAIGGDIEGILAAARQQGTRGIRARGTAAASRAGSGFNTLVQAQEGRDIADLETQLAGIAGELGLAGRGQVSEELLGAVSARGAGVSNIAALSNILKGAQTRGVTQELVGERSTTASLMATLEDILEKTRGKTTGTSVSSKKGFGITGEAGLNLG